MIRDFLKGKRSMNPSLANEWKCIYRIGIRCCHSCQLRSVYGWITSTLLTTFLSNRVGVFCWILWKVLNSSSLTVTIIRCRDHHDLPRALETPTLNTSQASHYVLEFTRQVSEGTEFKFAGYYKDLANLVTNDDDMIYLNQGAGFAQGTEVFLRHRAGDRFLGWGSYTYGLSKRRDRPGEPYRYYSFDQTHVATLAATYRFTPTWEVGLKWQYRTGNPYTPVLDATQQTDPRQR